MFDAGDPGYCDADDLAAARLYSTTRPPSAQLYSFTGTDSDGQRRRYRLIAKRESLWALPMLTIFSMASQHHWRSSACMATI